MADRFRLLFITGEYPPMVGGIADYTHWLAQALAAQGVQVEVLTSRRAAQARRGGDTGSAQSAVRVHAAIRWWSVPALPWLIEQIDRIRPDLVHIQYQPAAFDLHGAIHTLPALLSSLRRLPTVVTFHDLRIPYLFPKAGPVRELANCTLARTAEAVVTTNDEDRQGILDWGLPTPQVFAIPLGQNLPPATSSAVDRPNDEQPGDAHTIGFFGLVNRSKGLETLIEAVARLRNAGRQVMLRIIGGGAGASDATNVGYLRELKALIARKGIGGSVQFIEPESDQALSSALRGCTVLALPFDDGASLRRTSLITALAHGVPTVTTVGASALALRASGVEGAASFILDESVARFVPPRDAVLLANAIADLLDDPAGRAKLGQAGAVAVQQLRWESIASAHVAVYRRVLERTHAGHYVRWLGH